MIYDDDYDNFELNAKLGTLVHHPWLEKPGTIDFDEYFSATFDSQSLWPTR